MSATYKIRVFTTRLAPNETFHTSQLLSFGTRWAVDQALCRMVKNGVLRRLARGLFVVNTATAELITAIEVAQHKARAFGNQIIEHATDAAYRLGILPEGNRATTFASSGSSSSFLFHGKTRIFFKRVSARKRKLAESTMGDVLRSLWQIGDHDDILRDMMRADELIGRSDRQELPSLAGLMPTWLHCRFKWNASPPPRPKATG